MIFGKQSKKSKNAKGKGNGKVVFVEETKADGSFGKSKINPQAAQDVLPFDEVYENGYFRRGNTFSIIFKMRNVDYKIKREREKDTLYERYRHFLSTLPSDVTYQEFIMNYPFDKAVLRRALVPDNKNTHIREDVLKDYQNVMSRAVDNAVQSSCDQVIIGALSYTPVTKLDNVEVLSKYLSELSLQAAEMGSVVTQMMPNDVFEVLHRLFHLYDNEPFLMPDNLLQHDVSLKDYIAPSQFKFCSKRIEVGSAYGCVMFVKHISKSCDDEFITDLLDNTYNIVVSKQMKKIDKAEALKILKRQMDDLEGRLEKRREINNKRGGEFIPFGLKNREDELKKLQTQLGDSNSDLFTFGVYIYVTADTEDALNDLILFIRQKALNHQVKVDILAGVKNQEAGLIGILPFALPALTSEGAYLGQPYYLLTDEVANFIPFSYHNVFDENGVCYGINQVTKAPLIINRSSNANGNAFILGTSGSGKSMDLKAEFFAAYSKYPNDEFIVIDPENEYRPLAAPFDAEVVKLSPNTDNHINIFDTDLSYSDDGSNAIKMKSDFIMTFVEAAKGIQLTANERSLIDRCVKIVYQAYQKSGDKSDIPTLTDFYKVVKSQAEPEAQDIALAIELFTSGSFDIFAHKTNVEYNKKFIIFDIFDLGKQLETVGSLVLLEMVWQRVIDNKMRGVRTWVWTDEFSIMFNDNSGNQIFSTGDFFVKIYKRIRKHGGMATGATQNITEVLQSKQAMSMLSNSEFIMLLMQKRQDLNAIVNQWDLSESQVRYIDTDEKGSGLIISGKTIVPFSNKIPSDSLMYSICTTKFEDIQKAKQGGTAV